MKQPNNSITASELCKAAGCTYRQLDYWCRTGILETINQVPGTGHSRYFDKEIVPKVKLLADISKALNNSPGAGLLRLVYLRYDEGCLELGEGIQLRWEPNPKDSNDPA